MKYCLAYLIASLFVWLIDNPITAQQTSLTDKSVTFEKADANSIKLSRGNLTVTIINNAAIDTDELPKHRAGYSGIAKLVHRKQERNIFVPGIAGLNFEHIHDGTTEGLVEKFEPRKFPMELRRIDKNTVELYQPPTENWKLESCGRYRLLENDTIEYTFECIPRETRYSKKFIGLFWASYIHQPEDKSIRFIGKRFDSNNAPKLVKGITPKHGIDSTHRPAGVAKLPPVDSDFPLTLVNHPSNYEYSEPWYYGVSHGMALVQMFRKNDQVWLAQSPSGGGNGNPAWDFQWFIKDPVKDKSYGFEMRMVYIPFENTPQLVEEIRARYKKWQGE